MDLCAMPYARAAFLSYRFYPLHFAHDLVKRRENILY